MAHRKSPARLAKAQRLQQFQTAWRAHQTSAEGSTPSPGWAALEAELRGRVVLPGDPGYEKDRQEANPAFQAWPLAIIYCACEHDVVLSLRFAAATGLSFVLRSGGHSTAGFSVGNGLVIDTSELDDVVIDAEHARVFAGAGANWDKVNGTLNHTGWHIPTGACGSVCVAGFVQGGGYGYTSRAYGIQSDCVESFRIALVPGHPLGEIVTASETTNPDLFWALRGGTGGNFGALLQVCYRAVHLPSVWGWAIAWDAEHAAEALQMLYDEFTITCQDDALGYMMNIGFNGGQPVYLAQGMYAGTRDAGMAAIAKLLALPSARLVVDRIGTYPDMDAWLEDHPYPLPDQPAGTPEGKASRYLVRAMPRNDWQAIVEHVAASPNRWTLVYTEPYGGAIARYPVDASAFVHRQAACNLVIDIFWQNEAERMAMRAWLDHMLALIGPFSNGEVYQNYPEAELKDWPQAYFGSAFPRLQVVKAKYDPGNFFRYSQSIPPAY